MRAACVISIAAAVCLALTACTERRDNANSNTWTYATGVTLIDVPTCLGEPRGEPLTIRRIAGGYRVGVSDYFMCQDDLAQPYLVDRDMKVTLVLAPKRTAALFHTSCECARSLSIDLRGRLTPSQTLYVVNDQEVVGHLIVP